MRAERERERMEYEKYEKKKTTKQKHPDVARVGAKRKCISDNLKTLALKVTKQVTLDYFLNFYKSCSYRVQIMM